MGSKRLEAARPEANRLDGMLWWNVDDGNMYIWYIEENHGGTGSQWVVVVPQAAAVPAVVGNTEPSNPIEGQLWYDQAASALKCRVGGAWVNT